ncbi:hypothetical protein SAMN04487976_1315 [Xaviernesmea oryzae]|nr:hypothetical protein SAMN04487976_1315 [Xaviernesmea oryzae]
MGTDNTTTTPRCPHLQLHRLETGSLAPERARLVFDNSQFDKLKLVAFIQPHILRL